ncbi:hypothetical protein PI124_g12951 [Phytophthora idaei]|nr:hypothetical protein PI125_g12488 [Phytophthora idaei]KAG3150427.1 hypothetical protein PI126_g11522 [Phytophthora idaei]KAG3242186.1 hypothetical protein PI124_g12951 [Phytophthora idaei]
MTGGEDARCASCVGNQVPHGVNEAPDVATETSNGVGNDAPRNTTSRRRKSGLKSLQTDVASSDSESRARVPPTRPAEERYHVFDGETDRRVKTAGVHLEPLPKVAELLNVEELKAEDFLAELKAGEMVLLRRETTVEELNFSSVMDKDVLEDFKNHQVSRLGSEILKDPTDPVYPLMKEVVSKDPTGSRSSARDRPRSWYKVLCH